MNGGNDAESAMTARSSGSSVYLCRGGQPSCDQRLQRHRQQRRADPSLDGGAASDPAELETLGTAIVETALDASKVARKLIDWARRATAVEGGQSRPEIPAVDLNRLIREKLESEKSIGVRQVDWVLNLGSIPPIPGDAGGLRAMLGYLLQNAREALPTGAGTIEVSTYIDPRNWLVVAIRDTGCGMSPEVLKRATEPFFSTKPDHSGVGLTIAQGIWRRHRGVALDRQPPGQGTTIRLRSGQSRLPASRDRRADGRITRTPP